MESENKKRFNPKKIIKRFINRKIVFPFVYWKAGFRKPIVENKIIFLEIRFPELTDSYQKLYDTIQRDYDADVHVHYFRQGFIPRKEEYKRKLAFFKDAATAKYVVFNDSSDTQGTMKKRKGQHFLNTWHAAGAFKRFGFSTAEKNFGSNKKELQKYPLHPDYDMVTVSSPEICWAYIEAMGKEDRKECVKPVGLSRTDIFFDEDYIKDAYRHVHTLVPQTKDKKILLYAPTFRGTPRHAAAPDQLDIRMLYENFSKDYVLLIKHHPMIAKDLRPVIPDEFKDFAMDITDDAAIADLLTVADVCITDYSSIIYEYSIFERPLIFFSYDLEEYFDDRGFFYDYNELTPGPVVRTTAEIVEYMNNLPQSFDKAKIHEFKERFMSACDGHATDRIMSEFFTELGSYKKDSYGTEVSIVMPAYNAERFIDESLASLKKQTFKDFEVIVIDDASSDGTVDVAKKYTRSDRRFKVVEQEHANAGVARNRGIDLAKGKYVLFLDADDFLDPEALEKLYTTCEKNNDDICIYKNYRYDHVSRTKTVVDNDFGEAPELEVFSVKDVPDRIFNICTNVPWNKMIRLDFIRENDIRFQNIEKAEDAFFSMAVIAMAKRVSVLDEYLLYWRYNQGSLTTDPRKAPNCIFEAFEKTREYLEERGIYEDVKQSFINKALDSYIYWVKCAIGEAYIDSFDYSMKYIQNGALKKLGVDELTEDYVYSKDKYRLYTYIMEDNRTALLMYYYDMKGRVDARILMKKMNRVDRLLERIEEVRNSYEESTSYKVGLKVTWPFRKIKSLLTGKKMKRN